MIIFGRILLGLALLAMVIAVVAAVMANFAARATWSMLCELGRIGAGR